MSVSRNVFLAVLCSLICTSFLILIVCNFFPWPEEEGYSESGLTSGDQSQKGEQWRKKYRYFIAVNFFLQIGYFWIMIGSLHTEDRAVCYLQYPFTLCRNVLTGREISWMRRSEKHTGKIKDLTTTIKFRSYAVKKIGVYQVCFEELFRIGCGSNATEIFVGLGTDGLEVAVKRMDYKFCELAKNVKNAMNSTKLVGNPHVLNYRFYEELNKQYVCIITDLKEESLKDFVLSKNRKLDELKKKGPIIFRQILLGLHALHSGDILHKNLKPENILVHHDGKMILADFGIFRVLDPCKTTNESMITGKDKWRALESIPIDDDYEKPPEEITVRYKKESDIQSLGMIFCFVLTKGKHPFGVLPFDIWGKIKRGDDPDLTELTEDLEVAKDLIQWMLEHEVTKRPSVEQCLKHPYVSNLEEKFDLLKSVSKELIFIGTQSSKSKAVQDLNQALFPTSWLTMIDDEVKKQCIDPKKGYGENGTELLRFIRHAMEIWPSNLLIKFGTPQTYFLNKFPTLPMIVHNILRNDPDWKERYTLKKFF